MLLLLLLLRWVAPLGFVVAWMVCCCFCDGSPSVTFCRPQIISALAAQVSEITAKGKVILQSIPSEKRYDVVPTVPVLPDHRATYGTKEVLPAGIMVDTIGDGTADAMGFDTTGDGVADSLGYDTTGDGRADTVFSGLTSASHTRAVFHGGSRRGITRMISPPPAPTY